MRDNIPASASDNRSSNQWQSTGIQRGSGSTQSDRTFRDGSNTYNHMNGLTGYRSFGCSSNDSTNMENNNFVNHFEQSEANVHTLSTEYRSQNLQVSYPDNLRMARSDIPVVQSAYVEAGGSAFQTNSSIVRLPVQYSTGFQRNTVPNMIGSTSPLASASSSPSSDLLTPIHTSQTEQLQLPNGGRAKRLQANQKRSRQKRADAVQDLRRLVCPNDQSSEAEIFSKASEIIRQDRAIRLQLQEILKNAGMFMEDQEISMTDILSAIHSLAKHG